MFRLNWAQQEIILIKKHPHGWVRTSDPVIRSPARYLWTIAPETIVLMTIFCTYARILSRASCIWSMNCWLTLFWPRLMTSIPISPSNLTSMLPSWPLCSTTSVAMVITWHTKGGYQNLVLLSSWWRPDTQKGVIRIVVLPLSWWRSDTQKGDIRIVVLPLSWWWSDTQQGVMRMLVLSCTCVPDAVNYCIIRLQIWTTIYFTWNIIKGPYKRNVLKQRPGRLFRVQIKIGATFLYKQ